jgi:predicted MFS family arabinose efflux permease
MGVMVTFLPLAAPGLGPFSSATAILIFGLASTASRFWARRFGDRRDPYLLLAPGVIAAASGMAALPRGAPAMLAGALLFGVGLGVIMNSTLILTMDRVAENEHGLGSTLWNVSFDVGTGTGAFLFGFLVGYSGLAAAFYLSSALLTAPALVALDSTPRPRESRRAARTVRSAPIRKPHRRTRPKGAPRGYLTREPEPAYTRNPEK